MAAAENGRVGGITLRTIIIAGIILLGLVLSAVYFIDRNGEGSNNSTAGVAATVNGCPEEFRLDPDPNRRNRLFSGGVHGSPSKVRKEVLAGAAKDPRVLLIYWNASVDQGFTRGKLLKSEKPLISGKCLSTKGQILHGKLVAAFTLANARKGQAPSVGVNTGAHRGGSAFQVAGAIGGNRTATILTNVKGGKIFILHRCGNVVVERPIPKVPKKPPPERVPEKDPSKSVQYNPDVPDQVQGPGAGGVPAAPGENQNPNPETGCQGACDGQGTEPSPPPANNPPPPEEVSNSGTSPGSGGTAGGDPGPG